VRDILFLEDVCALVELQISQMERFRGDIFNLGGGAANSLSLREGTNCWNGKLGYGTTSRWKIRFAKQICRSILRTIGRQREF